MKQLLLLFFTLPSFLVLAQTELEKQLFLLENVIFSKIDCPDGYSECYKLMVQQPLDHKDPKAGTFYQRVYLSHRDFNAPNVLVTEGYQRPRNRPYELSDYFRGNQIDVEHRYYGESKPDSIDYRYLNLEQATADLHAINQIIRKLYTGPIISTGISKGGMTTLFYRYFYPDDVDVSIPYVAPINVDFKDKRIYDFLNQVGEETCRNQVVQFQKHLFENKEEYLPLVKWYAKGKQNTFNRLGIEGAYELAVLEYSFSFWQFGKECAEIPDIKTAEREDILDHFLSVSGVDFFSDKVIDGYAPFYYQMGNEMGYYGYETTHFDKYIDVVGKEPSAVFPPENVTTTFQPALTRKAQKWMTEELERVVYIYGSIDTWSATAVQPNKTLDALVINLEGKSHGNARIKNMTEEELELLESTLERWLGIDIQTEERP